MCQRRWYVARAATNEEIPTSLENKLSKVKEPSVVVQFVVDDKYSIIPTKKIEPFGNDLELDKKRSKSDPRGYSIATTKSKPNKDSSSPCSILAGRNLVQENGEDSLCSTMQLQLANQAPITVHTCLNPRSSFFRES